jgi:ribosomal protein S18 acetylase RimI-like enzyme
MITIREATEKDLEKIAEIAISCFPQDFADGISGNNSKKNAKNWIKERYLMKTFAKYHIAQEKGKTIGYILHLMMGGVSGVVQLEQIGVDSKYRRKGVGKKLILESEKFWQSYLQKQFKKSLYKMLLTTSKVNHKAHNLYAKSGFKFETTMKKVFWGEDEEIWVKEF